MDYNLSPADLSAIVISASGHVAGDIIPFQTAAQNGGTVAGVNLGVGTYRLIVSSLNNNAATPAQTSLISVQFAWQATVAGTIELVTCNFPGLADVTDFDQTFWIKHDPTAAYIPVSGSGNSVAKATVTAGGTNAGTCEYELGNLGARRVGFTLTLTAGGIVRCNAWGKLGG